MQKVVRLILISVLILVVGFGEYQIYVKGPQYAKPHSGTVVSAYESKGRSSCWLAFVQFDNGDYQEVNTGHQEYKQGERFTGTLSWGPIMGVSGLAYSWNPGDWLIFATMPAILFNIVFVINMIIALFVYAFGKKQDGSNNWFKLIRRWLTA